MKYCISIIIFLTSVFVQAETIRIIAPNNPGSQTDILARKVGDSLRSMHGHETVVENITGGEQIIALNKLLQTPQPALFFGGAALHIYASVLKPQQVNTERLKLLAMITTPHIYYVNPGYFGKATSAKDLIDALKTNQKINFGTHDLNSVKINPMLLIKHYNASNSAIVPYKNNTQIAIDVAAGRLDVGVSAMSPLIANLANEGKLVLLANSSDHAISNDNILIPSITKFTSAKQILGGIYVSAVNHPVNLPTHLEQQIQSIINSEEFSKLVKNLGMNPRIYDAKSSTEYVLQHQNTVRSVRNLLEQP